MGQVRRFSPIWLLVMAAAMVGCGDSKDGSVKHPLPGTEPLKAVVVADLAPAQASLGDKAGGPRSVGSSRDSAGVQTDFVLGEVLLHPESESALETFLARYGAQVLFDNEIPEPPASLGIQLLPEEREATAYLVRLDLGAVDVSSLQADAASVGLEGLLELSSDDALRTLAAITNAAASGFSVSPNFVQYPAQFPRTVFHTEEGGGADAFLTPGFGASDEQSNVTLAWQFVWAHGIQRRVRVAIIDGGFWLDSNGRPLTAPGDRSDLDEYTMYDFDADKSVVRGAPNPASCTGEKPCPWHGNGAAGVATGRVDNRAAAAGTGGLVADPMLLHTDIRDMGQRLWALRTAVGWGADVVNMSFGGPCNYWCRQAERFYKLASDDFKDASDRSVILVAAAGNNKADVVGDNYYHPCLIDHVICVGAIDTKAQKASYSNFGAGVDIWAPTDIKVMADGADPSIHPFGGTSAAAPFVAGVAAMMKALDPSLTSDRANQILRETAHVGTSPVDFYIDAYQAVRRAAEGKAAVKDRFEPNGPGIPTEIGSIPWSAQDLNLHMTSDADSFRFESPRRTDVSVSVDWPRGLGDLPVQGLATSGTCGPAVLVSDDDPGAGPRHLRYRMPGGPGTLTLGGVGSAITSYDLGIDFQPSPAVPPDGYEYNDEVGRATPLSGRVPVRNGGIWYLRQDHDVSIDATIHTATDVDLYVVSGSTSTPSGGGYFHTYPTVSVYGNESPISMDVFRFEGGRKGALVGGGSLSRCDGEGIVVTLDAGSPYLVQVKGQSGRYGLTNGIRFEFDKSRLPVAIRESPFDFVNPGPPIDRWVRNPLNYVLVGDPAFREVQVMGKNLHMELFDLAGAKLASGAPAVRGFDEVLDLRATLLGQVYILRLTPTAPTEIGQLMALSWAAEVPSQSVGNLIRNPGAEEGPDNPGAGPVEAVEGWETPPSGMVRLFRLPTYARYGDGRVALDPTSPGPDDRGNRFFAGGWGALTPVMRQGVLFDREWQQAVAQGAVRFELSAFLGGFEDLQDGPIVRAWFADSGGESLGEATLGPVTPDERGGRTGLFPAGSAGYVPPDAIGVVIELAFPRIGDETAGGYADNLEFVLQDFSR